MALRRSPVILAFAAVACASPCAAQTAGRLRPSVDVVAPSDAATPASPEAGLVRRRPSPAEADPFAPLGIRAGTFVILPSADLEAGAGDNLNFSSADPKAGVFGRATGEVVARSDWLRHALEARIRGSIDAGSHGEPVLGPTLDAELKGRIDVMRTTRLELSAAYSQFVALPSSAAFLFGTAERPEIRQSSAQAALTQEFGRLTLTASGLLRRFEAGDTMASDGTVTRNSERAYDTVEGRLRSGYEVSGGFRPFVETFVNSRDYDAPLDPPGVIRGSDGFGAEAGIELGAPRLLTGEAAIGWQRQRSRDPLLPNVSALTTRAALAWAVTPVTILRLRAATSIDETPFASSTLALTRTVGFEIEHSPRLDLTYLANASYTQADYAGTNTEDRWFRAGVGIVYKATRELWYRANYRYERLDSTIPSTDYSANIFTAGIRIQR